MVIEDIIVVNLIEEMT